MVTACTVTKKCEICHKKLPKRHRRFCGVSCRNKYYNRRFRDYQYAWQKENAQKKLLALGIDLVCCKVCGKMFRQVGSHIVQSHPRYATARDYREAYGFDVKRGQLSTDLRLIKAKHVFTNKTVMNLKAGKKFWFKPGGKGLGIYKRSRETLERLKTQFKYKTK
jgi:hypothetical protein